METLPRIGIYPETAQEFYPQLDIVLEGKKWTIELVVPHGEEEAYIQDLRDKLALTGEIFAYRIPDFKYPVTVLGEDSRTSIQVYLLE